MLTSSNKLIRRFFFFLNFVFVVFCTFCFPCSFFFLVSYFRSSALMLCTNDGAVFVFVRECWLCMVFHIILIVCCHKALGFLRSGHLVKFCVINRTVVENLSHPMYIYIIDLYGECKNGAVLHHNSILPFLSIEW